VAVILQPATAGVYLSVTGDSRGTPRRGQSGSPDIAAAADSGIWSPHALGAGRASVLLQKDYDREGHDQKRTLFPLVQLGHTQAFTTKYWQVHNVDINIHKKI